MKELEKAMKSLAKGHKAASDHSSTRSSGGWGDSPKGSRKGHFDDNGREEAESDFDYVPSARQLADKAKELETKLAQKEREVERLKNEVESLHKKEMESIMKAAAVSAPKKVNTATTQTIKEEEKVYPTMKTSESVVDYLEKFLEHYKHPNVLGVLDELKKMKSVGEEKTKEASALTRENRVLQKKFGDIKKSVEEAEKKLKEGGGGGGVKTPRAVVDKGSAKAVTELQIQLKDALGGKDALQRSLDTTSELLASTTSELQKVKGDLMAEKMKSIGLKSLIDTKEKQLESVKSALSEQKEALESLIEDQGEKDGEEKMKYMQMMGELNKKLEEVAKREAELGEREVRQEERAAGTASGRKSKQQEERAAGRASGRKSEQQEERSSANLILFAFCFTHRRCCLTSGSRKLGFSGRTLRGGRRAWMRGQKVSKRGRRGCRRGRGGCKRRPRRWRRL